MTKTKTNTKNQQLHIPVMQTEVLNFLDPKVGDLYLDLTAGYGGHAALVLDRTLKAAGSVLVDRDEMAVAQLSSRFEGSGVQVVHQDFLSAAQGLLRRFKFNAQDALTTGSTGIWIATRPACTRTG